MIRLFLLFVLCLPAQDRQQIKDTKGNLIGTIVCDRQRCEARDPAWRLKGVYVIKQNETRDPAGRLIAHGNVLARLF